MVFYVVVAILLFGFLIAIHEWGHFITAKWMGVHVQEFAIGMGPKIFSKQKGDTLYSLRAIPMGGFCQMEGEDEDTGNSGSFVKKAAWKKIIILSAGSFMNFVAGLFILLFLFSQAQAFSVPVINDFMEGFPYQSEEGLLPGDRIASIDGRKVYSTNDVMLYLALAKDENLDLVIERDGEYLKRDNFPLVQREYTTSTGETQMKYGLYFTLVEASFKNTIKEAWDTSFFFARSVWVSLEMLGEGQAGIKDLSGPVGIVSLIGEAGTQSESVLLGLNNVFYIIALVAVNLAVMNMLPIPTLDGGRIFLVLINRLYFYITKRELNPKYEAYIHAAGFVLLITLMIVVTFFDVIKLVR